MHKMNLNSIDTVRMIKELKKLYGQFIGRYLYK